MRRVEVTAVEDERRLEHPGDAAEVRVAELVPFRDHGQAVGVFQDRVLIVHHGEQVVVLEMRPGVGAGNGIEGHHAHALGGHVRDEFEGRGLAHVVGVGLEGQAPQGQGLAGQTATAGEIGFELPGQGMLLPLVDVIHRSQQLGLEIIVAGGVDQRLDVLGEAGAAVAEAGIDELVADAVVRTDAHAHLAHVGPDPFADVGHFVYKRDLGGQQAVGGRTWSFRPSARS